MASRKMVNTHKKKKSSDLLKWLVLLIYTLLTTACQHVKGKKKKTENKKIKLRERVKCRSSALQQTLHD